MKKILYFSLILSAFLFASCEREGLLYDMPSDSACVSFPSDEASFTMVAEDGNKVTIELWRGNTKGDASIAVTVTDDGANPGVFVPEKSTFDFKDGESKAYLTFNYADINNIGGETYEISVAVTDPKQVSPSGIDKVTIVAKRKLTPKYLGDGFYSSPDAFEDSWVQPLYNTVEAPNYYILADLFADGVDMTFTSTSGVPAFPEYMFIGDYYQSDPGWPYYYHVQSSAIAGNVISLYFYYSLPKNGYNDPFGLGVLTDTFTLPDGVTLN